MKAPDLIFVSDYDLEEYVRKEALLEWANEQIKVAKANNLAYSPFEKLIDKLNSM